jgi:biotin transport system permease protein
MAHLTPFSYRHGTSMLHTLDVRCKFFIICFVSMSMLSASLPAALLYLLILLYFFKSTGLQITDCLAQMKYFILLLIFVFTARALTVDGDIIFSFYKITISRQGLAMGFLVSLKFLLVMLTGLLFAATTKPSHVKHAVQWFLKPVPFIPEKQVAVMISLSLGFMPVILKQFKEVSDARKARCGSLERNPVKNIVGIGLPLLKKTFLSADNIILAMEARCYNDDRTEPEFMPSGREAFALSSSIILSVCLIYL